MLTFERFEAAKSYAYDVGSIKRVQEPQHKKPGRVPPLVY